MDEVIGVISVEQEYKEKPKQSKTALANTSATNLFTKLIFKAHPFFYPELHL